MLAVKGLNQFYGGSHTLWDVDLSVPAGSLICLMGRNGMGKTTLLKCIMGLLKTSFRQHHLRRNRPGEVPRRGARQDRYRVCASGTRDFFASHGGGKPEGGPGRAQEWSPGDSRSVSSTLFPVLKQMLNRRGGDLSGGQQQQLAIGRALVLEPKLLILDEPTEGIQPNIVHEIGDIILRLNKEEGLAVLLVEQKLPFARRVAQRILHPFQRTPGRRRRDRRTHRRDRARAFERLTANPAPN